MDDAGPGCPARCPEPPGVLLRQPGAGDGGHGLRRGVKEDRLFRDLRQVRDLGVQLDPAAGLGEHVRERVGDGLGSAPRDRPAGRVRGGAQEEPRAGCRGPASAAGGVGVAAGKHRGRQLPGPEPRDHELRRAQPEGRQRAGVPGKAQQRVQQHVRGGFHALDDRAKEPPVAGALGAQARHRPVQVAPGDAGPAVGQRVGKGDLRDDEVDVPAQPDLFEERGHQGHRVHRRAEVVHGAGVAELPGAGGPADAGVPFDEPDVQPGPGQGQRGGQPVGAGADDRRVKGHVGRPGQTCPARRRRRRPAGRAAPPCAPGPAPA